MVEAQGETGTGRLALIGPGTGRLALGDWHWETGTGRLAGTGSCPKSKAPNQ